MKGSTGTNTGTMIRMKKPKPIKCECGRCRHYNSRSHLCTWYGLYKPKKTKCARYWCVKPAKKAKL